MLPRPPSGAATVRRRLENTHTRGLLTLHFGGELTTASASAASRRGGNRCACRLLADGVDIRIIQLMLGHASVQQTQRYFEKWRALQDSNLWPSAPEADALSS